MDYMRVSGRIQCVPHQHDDSGHDDNDGHVMTVMTVMMMIAIMIWSIEMIMNYDQDITDDDGKDVGGNFDFIEKTQFVFLKVWHWPTVPLLSGNEDHDCDTTDIDDHNEDNDLTQWMDVCVPLRGAADFVLMSPEWKLRWWLGY